jgi:hypothetical protein
VAKARGYRSVDTKAELRRLGFGDAQARPPALVIPLHGVTGERVGYQLRPDEPRLVRGRLVKYETPRDQKMVLDVPPGARARIDDPAVPLFITEGPIKADAAVSNELCCVALLGVWNWRGTNDKDGRVALAAFEFLALNDRTVIIAFDSDSHTNAAVHEAMARLGAFLTYRGAQVRYLYLPHGENGAKVGLDDWLASLGGAASIWDFVTDELHPLPGAMSMAPAPEDTFDDIELETGAELLDDVVEELTRYVAFASPEQADAIALWIAHTHCLDVFDISPRLALLSPEKQCAKTRVLELVRQLARRARLSISMSTAYMFRAVEATCPTLLVDEVDAIFPSRGRAEQHEDLRALLNAGWERGATVGRMVGEGSNMVPKEFATFCPVALAGLGTGLPDTVLDRSVIVRMRRRRRDEPVEPYQKRKGEAGLAPLRRRLEAWAKRNSGHLEEHPVTFPDGIVDRPADAWRPLLAVAQVARGPWPKLGAEACLKLNAARADIDEDRLSLTLLRDIRQVLGEKEENIFSVDLLDRLLDLEDGPWSGLNEGRGLTQRGLAHWLRDFDVPSRNVRISEDVKKGYPCDALVDLAERYTPLTPSRPDKRNKRNKGNGPASDVAPVAPVALTTADTDKGYDPSVVDLGPIDDL